MEEQPRPFAWNISTSTSGRFGGSRIWNSGDTEINCEKLFELLREASWVHQHPDQKPGGSPWTGVIIAVHAVAQLIHDSGRSPELAAPFLEMKMGFLDLERGVVPPIFSLNPEPLQRDRASQRKFNQAWAAAILELAMESGESERHAATRIARSVNKWHEFQNQNVDFQTIINWRKRIKSGPLDEKRQFLAICEKLHIDPDRDRVLNRVLAEGPFGMRKS